MEENQVVTLPWKYNQGLRRDQLGREKYAKLPTAIAELISNGFDAGATTVDIRIHQNAMTGVDRVEISDNGTGMTRGILEERFLDVGNKPQVSKLRFGRFGLGRFATYRIGSRSDWVTTAKEQNGKFVTLAFSLDEGNSEGVEVRTSESSAGSTGTKISIYNTYPNETGYLTSETKLSDDVLSTFFSYLLAHPTKKIRVNNQELDPSSLVESESKESISASAPGKKEKLIAEISHIHLKKSVPNSRFEAQLLICSKGKCVSGAEVQAGAPNNYLALLNSDYFDELVTANRESLVEMDSGYQALLDVAQEAIKKYHKAREEQNAKSFLERARTAAYYPYREPSGPIEDAERAIYDVVLEKIHEKANLEKIPEKHRGIIFRLLNRAVKNADLLDVLEEVADLTDDDIERFKKVLKKTTLEQVIKLSDEVTRRLEFLKSLHEMVYGEIAKHLKERTQLHKVLENHSWLFGDKYHLSASDKSFRTIVQRHRSELSLDDVSDDDLQKISDVNKIPDLFLVKKRDYPIEPKHHHLIVEIKAPKVKIGADEVTQIKKYANTILKSSHFSKESVQWDLFLVSAEVSSDVDIERKQENRSYGLLHDVKGMKVWVYQWSEIIQRAEEEMSLIRNHLKLKTEELQISSELKKAYSFLDPTGTA